jgi:hypothetical protein
MLTNEPDPLGKVYFITDGVGIKIGYSGSPSVRRDDLQTSHWARLSILGAMPGTTDDEKRLHRRFQHLKMRGEWFRPAPDLIGFIEKETAADGAAERTLRAAVQRRCEYARTLSKTRNELRAWGETQPKPVRCRTKIMWVLLGELMHNPDSPRVLAQVAKNMADLKSVMAA